MEQIFIKNIKINKVRHLKNLDIPVCENKCKHIILTGQNGSGKTSILDAIAVFLNSIVMGKHPEDIFAMINDTQKYMEYIEMTINTSKDKKDLIEGILFDYGIYTSEEVSSHLVDELDQDEKDWDFIDYPLLNSDKEIFAIKVYPENTDDAEKIKAELEEKSLGQARIEEKDDEDWANNWKKYYKPLEIGESLAIVPEWEEYNSNRKIIKINPGMAFGTGTHESTYMCLELLENKIASEITKAEELLKDND